MSEAFAIEVRGDAAGIVVREGRVFRFFAASPNFHALEGRAFVDPTDAEHAARRHAGRAVRAGRPSYRGE